MTTAEPEIPESRQAGLDRETSYQGVSALVVGAARSGLAACGFLLSKGARVVLTDLQSEEALAPSLEPVRAQWAGSGDLTFELGGHKLDTFLRADLVVVSPGVPAALFEVTEARRRGIPVIAEVELAFRHLRGTVAGITGSNGKTTTTALAAEILRNSGRTAYAAGNIGVPLLSFVAASRPDDIYVTELSSFQLETIDRFRPRIAAVLNLSPDHLDRYAGFEDYVEAKRRIFLNQTADDWAVLNADDARAAALAEGLPPAAAYFSRRTEPALGCFLRRDRLMFRRGSAEVSILEKREIPLKGDHNLENVLAACAISMLAGADTTGVAEAVRDFKGVEHRLEWVGEIDGVQYFNDSKATNVDAALKSLQAFAGNVLLIAGGRDKGGDFTALRPQVRERVRHLVLLGEAAGKIREALQGSAQIALASSVPEAVAHCRRIARPGDVVLLAPACASFDMFRNYEERGRAFKAAVRGLRPGARD
ncbi:MAG: UDP-N-acetylmuramoyl-L-alanine--D-glutamate ligase [Acidobacteria bacterium]|nr:UDP-N-acetylmuramoyl-L-alanine--D-glutamate ligase [Acidobacteriota bacterium]